MPLLNTYTLSSRRSIQIGHLYSPKKDDVSLSGKGARYVTPPPLYTNNKIVPAGHSMPSHLDQTNDSILNLPIGIDERAGLTSLRARGYYKIPSLKGVWYRGPFKHNGSIATLEDWFDPRRLREDYVPTGYKPYGVKTRTVPGHIFGLSLSLEERAALVAFLKTL